MQYILISLSIPPVFYMLFRALLAIMEGANLDLLPDLLVLGTQAYCFALRSSNNYTEVQLAGNIFKDFFSRQVTWPMVP